MPPTVVVAPGACHPAVPPPRPQSPPRWGVPPRVWEDFGDGDTHTYGCPHTGEGGDPSPLAGRDGQGAHGHRQGPCRTCPASSRGGWAGGPGGRGVRMCPPCAAGTDPVPPQGVSPPLTHTHTHPGAFGGLLCPHSGSPGPTQPGLGWGGDTLWGVGITCPPPRAHGGSPRSRMAPASPPWPRLAPVAPTSPHSSCHPPHSPFLSPQAPHQP